MGTTLGAFNWSRTRGVPGAGEVTLASDPLAAVANTLHVSITDADGNDRDAVIDLVAAGDVIRVSSDFAAVVGTPVDNVTHWSFPFTVFASFEEDDEPAADDPVTLSSRTPAAWPTATEVGLIINLSNATTDHAVTTDRAVAAAIAKVKSDAGLWAEAIDLPTVNQAHAALVMAILLLERPDDSTIHQDPTYLRALTGQRRRFGIA